MKLIRIPAVTFPVNNNTRICLHFQRLSNLLVSWLKRKTKDTFIRKIQLSMLLFKKRTSVYAIFQNISQSFGVLKIHFKQKINKQKDVVFFPQYDLTLRFLTVIS